MPVKFVACLIVCSALSSLVGAGVERMRWVASFASLQAEYAAREGKRDAEYQGVFAAGQSGTSTITKKQARGK